MGEPTYRKAPADWNHKLTNPFTPDGTYGLGWSCFQILDEANDKHYYGRGPNGLFAFCAGRLCPRLQERLADFLRYESEHAREVILAAPAHMELDLFVRQALDDTPVGAVVRPLDPNWVVHSTTLDRWKVIKETGELKSLARLTNEDLQVPVTGFSEFGEPPDYAEYVMLGNIEGVGAEHVVASHGKGEVVTEEDTPYTPGVRLYFDCHRIMRDGLGVRDGVHLVKVHRHLPLHPYLVAAIGVKEVDPEEQTLTWTPRLFLEKANLAFKKTLSSG